MVSGLESALRAHGHEVEILKYPFVFSPPEFINQICDLTCSQNVENYYGHSIDRVIALQFPAYYVQHGHKTVWLMHQHRAFYDLFDESSANDDQKALREKVTQLDNEILKSTNRVFCISQNVCDRLKKYNDIDSQAIYHPPPLAEEISSGEFEDYVFYPSRFETLKRQDLLISAMQYTQSPTVALLAGVGSQLQASQQLAKTIGVEKNVRFLGNISDQERLKLMADCLGVIFIPKDEDYGYVTLEAMLASKPVITCNDSGGPLEFVVNNETGFIIEPEAKELARQIDYMYQNKAESKSLGNNGLNYYKSLQISWEAVVSSLLA